jgi:hypothetical protein
MSKLALTFNENKFTLRIYKTKVVIQVKHFARDLPLEAIIPWSICGGVPRGFCIMKFIFPGGISGPGP